MSNLKKRARKSAVVLLTAVIMAGIGFPTLGFALNDTAPAEEQPYIIPEGISQTIEEAYESTPIEGDPTDDENTSDASPLSPEETDESEDVLDDNAFSDDTGIAEPEVEAVESGEASSEDIAVDTPGITPFASTDVTTTAQFNAAVTAVDVDTIILGADITMDRSIIIPPSKTSLTIDGQGIYTLTQGALEDYLYSASTSGATYTFKNMTFVGRSFYGLVSCVGATNAPSIVIENVTYTGPQIVYNRFGTVAFKGTNNITIQRNATGGTSDVAEEVAEVHGVTIEGTLNVESTSTIRSFFWMTISGTENPFFTVKEGAQAKFSTSTNSTYSFLYADNLVYLTEFTVEDNATLLIDITGYNTFSYGASQRLHSMHIGANATVIFDFAGNINLANSLTVSEGATVKMNYLNQPGTSGSMYAYPLFRSFKTAGSTPIMQLNDPKLLIFAIQPTNRPFFTLTYANPIQLSTTEFSYWANYDAAMNEESPTDVWSAMENEKLTARLNLALGSDALSSITSNDSEFASTFKLANARVIQLRAESSSTDPGEDWINIRIPTTMLFGTLDSYDDGEVISPLYEMENYSEKPVDVSLVGMEVVDADGINLLESPDATREGNDLKLSLNVDGATVVDHLSPFAGEGTTSTLISRLEPAQRSILTLGGTYYGEFSPNTVHRPIYNLVWSFAPEL